MGKALKVNPVDWTKHRPLLWTILVLVNPAWTGPCNMCRTTLRIGRRSYYGFTYHIYIHSKCYSHKQECTEAGQNYWMAQDLGSRAGTYRGYTCTRGENLVCFSKLGQWGMHDGGGTQDQARLVKDRIEQLWNFSQIKQVKSGTPNPTMLPAEWHLFIIDLKDCFFTPRRL
uniref:Uncharacterized protein n=1 Tax=Calidris pygmaea TaxID=425635 RepID=A0A8C3J8H5_9CHAR